MAGFMDMLGTIMQQGMAQTGGTRMSNALGGKSGLEDLLGGLGQMMGGAQTDQAPAAARSGGMLGDVLGDLANNKAALGGLGALAGALLGGCATTDDPREGGLDGGLYGLSSGAYDRRIDERPVPQGGQAGDDHRSEHTRCSEPGETTTRRRNPDPCADRRHQLQPAKQPGLDRRRRGQALLSTGERG